MGNLNKVHLIGRLVRDPETRYIASGTAVATVTIVTSETTYDKSTKTKKETPAFIECTLWGKTAEIAGQYLKKGSEVYFGGKLRTEEWNDKTTGQKRSKLTVVVDDMQMLGGKAAIAETPRGEEQHPFRPQPAMAAADEDAPF